jgi:hypothetical protein
MTRALFPLPEPFWLDVARRSGDATFFHSPLWHRLITATWPERQDRSVGVELDAAARAVVPLLELERPIKGLFHEMESTWAGCYGGLISDVPRDPPARRAAWKAVLRTQRIARLHVTGHPFRGEQGLPEGAELTQDVTHVVALQGAAAPESRFSEGHRRSIRAAERAGVTVEPARTLDEYREYAAVYEDSLARWGERATSRYPRELFENGWRLGADHPQHSVLWLARHQDRIVAGAWIFTWNGHAVYWHGATRTDAMPLRPGHLLHATILRTCAEQGLAWYDFNPSGGHEGVARFKAGFGAEPRAVPRAVLTGRLFAGARAVRDATRR